MNFIGYTWAILLSFSPCLSYAQNPFPIDSNSGKILYRQSFHYAEQPSDTLFQYCYDCFVDLFFWGVEKNIKKLSKLSNTVVAEW